MAEVIAVVGIIASIINIIDGVDKTKTAWKKYLHTSSSLRAELLPILGKLTAFAGILRGIQLQCELDEADANRLHIAGCIEEPLTASEQAIRLISTRLERVFSVGRVSLTFGKVLNKETTAALHILDQAKSVLDLALAVDQMALAKSIESYVRNVEKHLRDARIEAMLQHEELNAQLHEINTKENKSLQAKVRAEVLAWISQVNYASNYHAAQQSIQRADTSGDWFIKGKKLQDWTRGGSHSRLLLTGISGSGKTVLCARGIDHVAQIKTVSGDDPVILYFFFDFNDTAKESVESMVRALLHQLLAKMDAVPDEIRKFHADHQSSTSTAPSTQDWVEVLHSSLCFMQNVFIFIDAMDECAEADHIALRSTLIRLFREIDNIKWLLTCRPDDRAISDFSNQEFDHVELETDQIDRDIEDFLSTRLNSDPKLSSFGKEARERIATEIRSRSGGMFRYAQCQLDSIAKLRDRRMKRVEEVLSTLPHDISESYARTLLDAQKLDDWPIIQRILVLVGFSARPVTVAEAAEFAILEDDMMTLAPEDRLDVNDALLTISSLVTVREGLMTLTHKSVQDFFANGSEPYDVFHLFQYADNLIASRCLQYLGFAQQPVVDIPGAREKREPNTTQLKSLLHDYPFLDYAATRWPHHLQVRSLQEEAADAMAATLPLKSPPNLWKAWLLLQRADIWENQIQLARLLCESFIRGSLIAGWSGDFWQERQSYRVRNDKDPQRSRKSFLAKEGMELPASSQIELVAPQTWSHFWVKAVDIQRPGLLMEEPILEFHPGDLIFIQSTPPGAWWKGSYRGKSGIVSASKVERCVGYHNSQITGSLFHDLVILLLEVAFQTSLFIGMTKLLAKASSEAELAHYLSQVKRLSTRATHKMGTQYGKVINECLANIYWLGQNPGDTCFDIQESQDHAMTVLCKPLETMLTTGFRASRSPLKHVSKPIGSKVFPFSPFGSMPYGAPPTAGPMSYSPVRPGSNQPFAYDRARSAEARYLGSASVFSQRTAYVVSAPVTLNYRPNSTSAAIGNYTTFTSSYTASTQEPAIALAQSIISPALPGSVNPLPSAVQSAPFTTLDTVVENSTDEIPKDITSSREQAIIATTNTDARMYLHFFDDFQCVAEVDSISSPIPESNLVWKFPDDLSYKSLFTFTDITPSDGERANILEAARAATLSSNDVPKQMSWACDVLAHVAVAESNRRRAKKALLVTVTAPESEIMIRTDAVRIIQFLATQGHPKAVFTMAKWSEFGRFGRTVDKTACLEGFTLASTAGHSRAWYRMGLQYEKSEDMLRSIVCYNRGVEAGDAAALDRMGMLTILGEYGQPQDVKRGMEMLHQAAENADDEAPHALYRLGMIYAHKMPELAIPNDLGPLDWKLAVSYLERAARFGFAKAQVELATAYEWGELGLEPNLSLALHYYILAAKRGEANAECGVSKIMLSVWSTVQEPAGEIAYVYAKRAAMDGLPLGQFAVGYYHELGVHVPADVDKALEWYVKASANGHKDAKARLDQLTADKISTEEHVDSVETTLEVSQKVEDGNSGRKSESESNDLVRGNPTKNQESNEASKEAQLQRADSRADPHKTFDKLLDRSADMTSGPKAKRGSRFFGQAKLGPVLAHFKKKGKDEVDMVE